jgi:hypothetical protein
MTDRRHRSMLADNASSPGAQVITEADVLITDVLASPPRPIA